MMSGGSPREHAHSASAPPAIATAGVLPRRLYTAREVSSIRVLTRRRFMIGSAASLVACRVAPVTHIPRPQHTHGLQIGDVSTGRALVWARCSEPARLEVEWDTTPRFARPQRTASAISVTPDADLAATVALERLPAAQQI